MFFEAFSHFFVLQSYILHLFYSHSPSSGMAGCYLRNFSKEENKVKQIKQIKQIRPVAFELLSGGFISCIL